VPAVQPHDSAVVRCAACGAPRHGDEAACRFCGSSFTVHERDLDTICPGCMARVSGTARFCSHCGSPILVDQAAAGASALRCPACPPPRQLGSRRLEGEPVAISECGACGGIWVERSVFEILVARARQAQLGTAVLAMAGAAEGPAAAGADGTAPHGPLYRPCAVCGRLMNRQNFGRKSGVIVDLCREHGIWFDLQELPRVLRWIQAGGEEQARQRDHEESEARLRQQRLESPSAMGTEHGGWSYVVGEDDADIFASLFAILGESVRHFFRRL
jgi:Zn-finger nucleic acid-binding protein